MASLQARIVRHALVYLINYGDSDTEALQDMALYLNTQTSQMNRASIRYLIDPIISLPISLRREWMASLHEGPVRQMLSESIQNEHRANRLSSLDHDNGPLDLELRINNAIGQIYEGDGGLILGTLLKELRGEEGERAILMVDSLIEMLPEEIREDYLFNRPGLIHLYTGGTSQDPMGLIETPVVTFSDEGEYQYTGDGEIGRMLASSFQLTTHTPEELMKELETLPQEEPWYDMAHFLLWYPEYRSVLTWILSERLDETETQRLLGDVIKADTRVALYPSDFGPLPDHPDVYQAVYRTGDQKGWRWLMAEHERTGSDESPLHLRQWFYLWPVRDNIKEMMDVLIKSGEIRFVGSWEDMFLSLVRLPLRQLAYDGTLHAYTMHPVDQTNLFAQQAREDRFLQTCCMTRA